MQNLWASMCKNKNTIYIYMMCIFFVWFTLWLIFYNYCDVILHIILQFLCIKHEFIYVCHSKPMFHPFEYLKYWICTNIIVVTYEILVFFKGAQKQVFSSILKFENVNTWNTWIRWAKRCSRSNRRLALLLPSNYKK
jgi:hypothetical protein